MFLKRNTNYLLFAVAYIGALIVEKPAYMGNSVASCLSYAFTVMVHFGLFAGMILTNSRFLIPNVLEKKFFGWYIGSVLILIWFYTFLTAHYNLFIHSVLLHDRMIGTSDGFWDNFIYALCCTVIASMLYITQKWAEQQEQVKNSQINQLANRTEIPALAN